MKMHSYLPGADEHEEVVDDELKDVDDQLEAQNEFAGDAFGTQNDYSEDEFPGWDDRSDHDHNHTGSRRSID
jgi:hypothetical protein